MLSQNTKVVTINVIRSIKNHGIVNQNEFWRIMVADENKNMDVSNIV